MSHNLQYFMSLVIVRFEPITYTTTSGCTPRCFPRFYMKYKKGKKDLSFTLDGPLDKCRARVWSLTAVKNEPKYCSTSTDCKVSFTVKNDDIYIFFFRILFPV